MSGVRIEYKTHVFFFRKDNKEMTDDDFKKVMAETKRCGYEMRIDEEDDCFEYHQADEYCNHPYFALLFEGCEWLYPTGDYFVTCYYYNKTRKFHTYYIELDCSAERVVDDFLEIELSDEFFKTYGYKIEAYDAEENYGGEKNTDVLIPIDNEDYWKLEWGGEDAKKVMESLHLLDSEIDAKELRC